MLSIRTFLFAAAISATVPAAYGQDARPSDEARAHAELPRVGGPGPASPRMRGEPAAPEAPASLVLPTNLVSVIRNYLGRQPHDDVQALVAGLVACVQVQVAANGAIGDRGQCPAVTAALAARAPLAPSAPSAPAVPGTAQ